MRRSPTGCPAARRDSLIQAKKIEHVFDSLVAAGVATKAQLATIKEHIDRGTIFELFQQVSGPGAGGAAGGRNDRPAESPLPRAPGKDTTKKSGVRLSVAGS